MIRIFAATIATLLLALPAQAFETQARAAYVVDQTTGTVLLTKNADEPLPPASMSKLMTLYMAFEAIERAREAVPTACRPRRAAMNHAHRQHRAAEVMEHARTLVECDARSDAVLSQLVLRREWDEALVEVRRLAALPVREAPETGLLFVNLHPHDLHDDDLVDPSSELTKIAPRVIFEITERRSITNVEHLRRRITQLREMGFRIAVDDLGAGFRGELGNGHAAFFARQERLGVLDGGAHDLAVHAAQLEQAYLFDYGTQDAGFYTRGAAEMARLMHLSVCEPVENVIDAIVDRTV